MSVTPSKKERIDFAVHTNIIHDLVFAQNGTVATALRELVMNAQDAKSDRCEIILHRYGFSLIDWGNGFANEAEIKTYFKNFGEPHDKNDAQFGRFRIGRGQIMAFGKITWTSNRYSMTVDTKTQGFSFDFVDHKISMCEGCRVDGVFYQPLQPSELYRIRDELKSFVCFADMRIEFNGEQLNKDIHAEHWDVDDGDILIQWKNSGGIKIYNQGVFVKQLDAYRYGFEALVVTRSALTLNMARNEVSDNDPLWLRICEHLSTRAKKIAKRKGKSGRIDTATRRSMIRLFLTGDCSPGDTLDLCFLKDCRGHSVSLRAIAQNNLPLTIAPEAGSRKAESVASRRMAQVLDVSVLDEFGVDSLDALIETVICTLDEYYVEDNRSVPHTIRKLCNKDLAAFTDIAGRLVSDALLHPKSKHTLRESAARNALQYGSTLMARELSKEFNKQVKQRNILLGVSDIADGWTNGVDTIVIAKDMLPYLDTLSRAGGFQLAMLLLHEYLHDEDDSGSHQHDFEFMSQFHDLSSNSRHNILGCVGMGLYTRYLTELTKKNLALPKKIRSEFNYPIINNVHRYVLVTKDTTVTPLTKTILEWLNLPFKKRAGQYRHIG